MIAISLLQAAIRFVRWRPSRAALTDNRHNFLVLLGDYLLFGIAFIGVLNPSVLPSDFITRAGGGPVLVGLGGMLFPVAWHLPQLLFARWVNRAPRKKHYVTLPGLPARLIFTLAGLLIIAVGPGQPAALIALFLAAYATLAIGDSICMLAWMDVIGSSLSYKARARMMGWGHAVYSLLVAVLVAPLVRGILEAEALPFPNNYAVLLILAGIVLTLGLASYALVREGPSPPPDDAPGMRQYGRLLGRILREDLSFRRYLLARFVYHLVEIGLPFYIVFATGVLGQTSAVAVSDQIVLTTTSGALASVLLGYVSERRGARPVILIGTTAALLHPLLALSSSVIGPTGLHLTWITIGVVGPASMLGLLTWLVEYAPPGYRPIYSGLTNTVSAVAWIAPLFGGLIVQAISYQALFVVASALGGAALLLALRLPEPRHTRAAQTEPVLAGPVGG